jgi:HEAT repeat protein
MPELKSPSSEPLSADNSLPPVQPPSAAFIVQLFVIPGVIVLIIVLVWLLFNWLAQMGSDPTAYVQALRKRNPGSWHAAVNLANALHSDRTGQLRGDRQLARELATILDEDISAGSGLNADSEADAQAVNLRIYLCKALGEFNVDAGVDALLRAATTERSEAEVPVRIAAIESLAVLAERLASSADSERMARPLIEASRDDDRRVRSVAAFALGVIGRSDALTRLQSMLGDPIADVRYNAATGLARHGRAESAAVLVEMLLPDQSQAVELESTEDDRGEYNARDFKTNLIHMNGLRAVEQLAKANATADLSMLNEAIDQLLAAENIPGSVRTTAQAVGDQLHSRSSPATAT